MPYLIVFDLANLLANHPFAALGSHAVSQSVWRQSFFLYCIFCLSRIIFPGDCLVCTGVKGFSAVGRGSPPGYPMPERP